MSKMRSSQKDLKILKDLMGNLFAQLTVSKKNWCAMFSSPQNNY